MDTIASKHRGTSYSLLLPFYNENNSNHANGNGIPMSSIVKYMNQQLSKISNQRHSVSMTQPAIVNQNLQINITTIDNNNKNTNTNTNTDKEQKTQVDTGSDVNINNNNNTNNRSTKQKQKSLRTVASSLKLAISIKGNTISVDDHQHVHKSSSRSSSLRGWMFSNSGSNSNINNGGMEISTGIDVIKNNFKNKNNIETSMKVDVHSLKMGKIVIHAFGRLYEKYVCSSSDFAINIRSQTRDIIHGMFDTDFYAMWLAKKEKQNANNNDDVSNENILNKQISISDLSLWYRLRFASDAKRQTCDRSQSFVKAQFEKYTEINGPKITEAQLIEWLLTKIIIAMETAVIEICYLINDSYIRFRNNQQVFNKAVQLAKKFHPR